MVENDLTVFFWLDWLLHIVCFLLVTFPFSNLHVRERNYVISLICYSTMLIFFSFPKKKKYCLPLGLMCLHRDVSKW